MILVVALAVLAALSLLLSTWQLWLAWRFPLHRRTDVPSPALGVSILKPLRNCDSETRGCLRSWLTQQYAGPVEVLFGVADERDPVCHLVQELMAEFPNVSARLLICRPRLGPNAKVSTLAHLEQAARHDILCVNDADVWAPPDFLAQTVSRLEEPGVRLVNAFYRMAGAQGFAMRCEAFTVNADFWAQVLQARSLGPIRFALGAAMVLRRNVLKDIGGFRVLTDFLADDYHLGKRIAETGKRITLASVVVECRAAAQSWRAVWKHQVRWARTIRSSRPAGYFFSILGHGTLWPALSMLAQPTAGVLAIGTGMLLLRVLQRLLLEGKMTGRFSWKSCAMAGAADLVQLLVWAFAFLGNRVQWGDETFQLGREGRLLRPRRVWRAPPRRSVDGVFERTT